MGRRLAIVALALLIPTVAACTRRPVFQGHELEPPRAALDFALTDQFDRTVRLSALHGQVVALTFLYTTCPDVCPLVTAKIHEVTDLIGDRRPGVAFVAVTVDPERDTAPAVAEYSRRWAMLDRWRFLTGTPRELAPIWEYGDRSQLAGSPARSSRPDPRRLRRRLPAGLHGTRHRGSSRAVNHPFRGRLVMRIHSATVSIAAIGLVVTASAWGQGHMQHMGGGQPPATTVPPPIRTTMEALHAQGGVPEGWKFLVPPGDPAKGREVFVTLECFACHEVKGEDFPRTSKRSHEPGPALTGMGSHHPAEYFAESIVNPNRVIVQGAGYTGPDGLSRMPDYGDVMTVRQLVDAVAYLTSLKGGMMHEHAPGTPMDKKPMEKMGHDMK